MSEYPEATFLKELVRRTKVNLEIINREALADPKSAYEVTQLLNSLFSLVIVPEQKYYDSLAGILIKETPKLYAIRPAVQDCDTKTLNYQMFIEHLRNCICHPKHMTFTNKDGEIESITFVDEDKGVRTFSLTITPGQLRELCEELCDCLMKHLHL